MSEIWKTSCFSNEYSVSNMGRVKRNSTGKIYSNKISKGKNRLHLKGLKLDITVSREVLSAFHGKPDENKIVHYKDGNKLNDTLENMEWIERGQNNVGISYNSSRVNYSIPSGEIRELTWGEEKISVSSDGFVRTNSKRWKKPTIPDPTKNGYVSIWLPFDSNGKRKEYGRGSNHLIHRIIAEAFCERKNGQNEVDHIDRDKSNNVASNLRWTTRIENSMNRDNSNDQNKKVVYKYKIGGEYTGESFESLSFAAQSIGFTSSTISGCINGKRPHSGNFEWSIFEPEEYKGRREGIMKMVKAHQNKEKEDRDAKKGPKKETGKKVFVYKDGTFFGEYKSGVVAGEATGCSPGNISKCISGKLEQTGGFTFSRTKTSEEECTEESPNKKMRVE